MYLAYQQQKKMESLTTNVEELPKRNYCINDADALRRYRPPEQNLEAQPYNSINSLGHEGRFNSYNSLPSNYASIHHPSDAYGSFPESVNKPPTQPVSHLAGDRTRFETRSHGPPLSSMKKTEEFRLDSVGDDKQQLYSNIEVEPASINLDAHQNSMNPSLRSGTHLTGPITVPSQASGQNSGDKLVARNRSAVMGTVTENESKAVGPNYGLQRGPLSIRNEKLNKANIPNESVVLREWDSNQTPSFSKHIIPAARPNEFERKLSENPPYQGVPSVVISQSTPGTRPNEYGSQVTHLNQQGPPLYQSSSAFSESQGSNQVAHLDQQGFPPNSYQGARPNQVEHSASEHLLFKRPVNPPDIESMQHGDNRHLQRNIQYGGFPDQNAPPAHSAQYAHPTGQHQPDGRQENKKKKVFILHFGGDNLVLQLAVALIKLDVDVTLDLFQTDVPPDNWPLWYEQNIKSSDVVLCIITENFYRRLTNSDHTNGALENGNRVMGFSLYNLMNDSSIAVRAVFLNSTKVLEYIPPSMRGATCYQLDINQLDVEQHEDFASLYAFLTGQNRIEKPTLGKMVVLTPRKSRFGQRTTAPAGGFNRGPPAGMGQPPPAGYNMGQPPPGGYNMGQPLPGGYNMGQPPPGGYNMGQPPPMAANRGPYQPAGFNQGPPPQQQFQPSGYGAPPGPATSQPDVDQANLLYSLLAGDTTAISTVRTHNRMFQTLATKMAAEWEPLGRALGLRDPEVYAIRRDHGHSVVEQAVQMFRTWLEKNGSRATFGALTMAVYDTGMQYWNLLEILNKHTL